MDIAKAMDCSVPTARSLFYRDDFRGLNYKVLKSAFLKLFSERHFD